MEGLEISVISSHELITDNEKFRFDNEFLLKRYLQAYNTIKRKKYIKFNSIIEVLTDFHANGSYEDIAKIFMLKDEKDYAYMVRTTDLENFDYESDVKYISKECYDFLAKSKLFGDELLINKIGAPGKTYLMPKLNIPASLGMNLFMIRLKKDCGFNTSFLWAYFNSFVGECIIKRKVNGTVPLTIDKEAIKSLYIPIISSDFQGIIENLVLKSNELLAASKQKYDEAENLLLKGLALQNWEPTQDTITEKNISAFVKSGRLDAEYYQPKYDELFEKLKQYNTKRLSEVVEIKKSIEPGSEAYENEGIPFMRVANLTKFGLTDTDIYLSTEQYSDVIRPRQNTILLSKDGSVGIAYKVETDMNIITSGAILHLTVTDNDVLPDFLTLVLNSVVVKMQAERDAGGSVIQHWKPSEIENVIIPILSKDAQEEITSKIRDSFNLRAESERLLDLAKTAVEVAIEQGEDKAIDLLSMKLTNNI